MIDNQQKQVYIITFRGKQHQISGGDTFYFIYILLTYVIWLYTNNFLT